ncbi:thiol peroxidase [Rasiella rasia]|uniref:Thiol peroxidase n=1 Tax=Rasiella rasia TaxID=2744027 RepID=A0A6G6GJZ4_9FLAO|nr:thiol peroxidase [Rasiella rasia]QIE58872.1 thiol peroxidase [Rasiella rasia]
MANITLGGTPIKTSGNLPAVQSILSDFELTATDLSTKTLSDYKGYRKLLNIFPSVDTGVCAASSRKFNEEAASLENTKVLCISRDLPFAQARFCAADGLEHVEMLSDFKTGSFGKQNGLDITTGAFEGLHSRVVLVLDENNTILYSEQVPEIGQAPNYENALNALK